MIKYLILLLFFTQNIYCKINYSLLKGSRTSSNSYLQFAHNLIKNKKYFSAVPFIKEYMSKNSGEKNKSLDQLVDLLINHVGIRQFEVLPISILNKSSSPTIHYIKARKFFRMNKLKKALYQLKGAIPNYHNVKPFSLLLEGTIYSMLNRHVKAKTSFKRCINLSKFRLNKTKIKRKQRQLDINMQNCKAGIARDLFANKKFNQAELAYLQIDKKAFIWPELLFEEAWNSFYQKNYNRTLGKLVTYKAPIFEFIFNPEINILRALSYMNLCLWGDVNKVVDSFYKQYEKEDPRLARLLKNHGKNYKFYYSLILTKLYGQKKRNRLLNQILTKIVKDPTFIELYDGLIEGKKEFAQIKNMERGNGNIMLLNVLKDSLLLQRNLIGAYVFKELVIAKVQLSKAFQDMSFIKLSILSKRKKDLYLGFDQKRRERGDIKYLKRNQMQYFWSFNGEFWADELGDYVFTLESKCN